MIRIWLLALLLSGCSMILNKSTTYPINAVDTIPSVWQAKGRIGGIVDQQVQNSGFDITFKDQFYKLTLSAVLGLGEIVIESNSKGLWVDKKLISTDFKQWMISKVGWYFPILELPKIIFKNKKKIQDSWMIKVTRYHQINNIKYPKLIRLNHLKKPIKIKLMLTDIKPINK
jgi:outer membrane biogenesis lipoprotein LolB